MYVPECPFICSIFPERFDELLHNRFTDTSHPLSEVHRGFGSFIGLPLVRPKGFTKGVAEGLKCVTLRRELVLVAVVIPYPVRCVPTPAQAAETLPWTGSCKSRGPDNPWAWK